MIMLVIEMSVLAKSKTIKIILKATPNRQNNIPK